MGVWYLASLKQLRESNLQETLLGAACICESLSLSGTVCLCLGEVRLSHLNEKAMEMIK